MPLPLIAPSVPPVAVTALAFATITLWSNAKVIVAVSPAERVVSLELIAAVGCVPIRVLLFRKLVPVAPTMANSYSKTSLPPS